MSMERKNTMELVEDGGVNYSIMCHRETGVMYFLHGGGACVMVSAEGKPLIYSGSAAENGQQGGQAS